MKVKIDEIADLYFTNYVLSVKINLQMRKITILFNG